MTSVDRISPYRNGAVRNRYRRAEIAREHGGHRNDQCIGKGRCAVSCLQVGCERCVRFEAMLMLAHVLVPVVV